jgi:hypothetical protein
MIIGTEAQPVSLAKSAESELLHFIAGMMGISLTRGGLPQSRDVQPLGWQPWARDSRP